MKSINAPEISRRNFLQHISIAGLAAPFVTRNLLAAAPNSVVRHASFGASGMAWSDLGELTRHPSLKLVAVAEVDLNRTADLKKKFPDTKIYQDWREMLDKEKGHLDSVNVSTPDHMHAPQLMSAMQRGLHVYGQKPLAHDLYEVRQLTKYARQKKLVTQMGIQIHSNQFYRMAVQMVQAGVVGKIKEVHSWCGKSWGDPTPRPDRKDPVPAGFNWDWWLGVCAERPFIGDTYYHPANWRKRLDFGTGTFGDMGCHIFDPVFNALELSAPLSIRSEGAAPNRWNWALDSRIHYVFPGTRHTAEKTVNITWYDGDQRPAKDIRALLQDDDMPPIASLFIGEKGSMLLPHWARPQLYPINQFKDFVFPQVQSLDHWGQFVDACRGSGKTTAGFDYSGPLTESVLLGGVASHFPKTTLEFNSQKLKFNLVEANQHVRRTYRKGWGVKEL
jgi:predicted dehydrogenase